MRININIQETEGKVELFTKVKVTDAVQYNHQSVITGLSAGKYSGSINIEILEHIERHIHDIREYYHKELTTAGVIKNET